MKYTWVLKKKWVWVLSFNSKLKPKTHQKWVTRLKLNSKPRLKTHWKWDSNSILKLIFFEFPCMEWRQHISFIKWENELKRLKIVFFFWYSQIKSNRAEWICGILIFSIFRCFFCFESKYWKSLDSIRYFRKILEFHFI